MTETIVTHILDQIPFEPDIPWLLKRLRIKEGSLNHAELEGVLEQARPFAHPRSFYRVSYINNRGDGWVDIDSVRFSSRVLQVNLDHAYRVFPYLATCGQELQAWADGIDDMLINFWAETVKEAALFCAVRALFEDINERYHPGRMATMSPGSLADWPIEQQKQLFQSFSGFEAQIGVQLTDSLLMVPTKTVSGIRFTTELEFESCQLCPREGCPGRRAVYNPDLYDSRYCRQNGLNVEKN